MNYTALQADVAAHLHRSDLATPIQGFIERGRVRLMRDLRVAELEAAATLVGGSPFNLPAACQEVRRVSSSGTPLRQVPPHELDYWASASSGQVYAIYGRVLDAPGADEVDIWYFAAEPQLTSGTTEHPTMAAYPQLWIAAAMLEASLFLNDRESLQQWTAVYDAEVTLANRRAERLRQGTAPATISSDYYTTFAEAPN
jgi:hypothetical protein